MDTDYRGRSVYDQIEADGWKSIAPPRGIHSVKCFDCFRKGTRRAYITAERSQDNKPYWFAVEAEYCRDKYFDRPEWLDIGVLAFDGNTPQELRDRILAQFKGAQCPS